MRTIKIFLASSEELAEERIRFGDFIRQLDDMYEVRDYRIKLYKWEDFPSGDNGKPKQDEYNEKVSECDMFVGLFHTKAGPFTLEEYETAKRTQKSEGKPTLYIFCRELAEGEKEDTSLTEFKARLLNDIRHYWNKYNNSDSLKLQFILQLMMVENRHWDNLTVKNGSIRFGDIEIAQMDSLRFASENIVYQEMQQQLNYVENELLNLKNKIKQSPTDDVLQEYTRKIEERDVLKKNFNLHQQQLLDTAKRLAEMQLEQVSDKLHLAIEAFDNGEIERANQILEELSNEADRFVLQFNQERTVAHKYVEVYHTSAKEVLLNPNIAEDERVLRAYDYYRKADSLAEKGGLDRKKYSKLLFDYAQFLYSYQIDMNAGGEVLQRLKFLDEKMYVQLMTVLSRTNRVDILFIGTGSVTDEMLATNISNELKGMKDTFIIFDTILSTELSQFKILESLTKYDIIIFDGTIEDDAELNNTKYDFLDPSILLRDNFLVVTRNTLPMNIVPPLSNLNQFGALRNNMYQIDKNRFDDSFIDGTISNEAIVEWIQQEIKSFIATHEDYHKPETPLEVFGNLKNDVGAVMAQYAQSKKKQIFVSFRGRYQAEKYYGFNIDGVKEWIKNTYHDKGKDEWDDPFIYDSGALTSELMPEQRLWTVQSIISSKIQDCDEFWIFETLQERDDNGNLTHYSYWDSWWCVAEVMEVLQMHTRGLLNEDFKLHIFNPTLPGKHEEIKLEDLPTLTAFEERELMRLKCEGNIERSNLHLRDDKRGFRDASWLVKKFRYKVLKVQWNQISQMCGEDISIPFDQYVEDVNCRVYDDAFLTQRIYMDPERIEIGRKREDVLKEGYCKHFLNLVGAYKDTEQYEGIYMTTTEELENCLKHNLPIIVRRKEGGKMHQKELKVEEYGKMFFFWIPLRNPLSPNSVKRTGPNGCTIQEIPLYRIKQ